MRDERSLELIKGGGGGKSWIVVVDIEGGGKVRFVWEFRGFDVSRDWYFEVLRLRFGERRLYVIFSVLKDCRVGLSCRKLVVWI